MIGVGIRETPARTEQRREIFVFGSNLAGRHGKGAALHARQHHGAAYGVGLGLTGNAFAIPTKDRDIRTLPLSEIERYVTRFKVFAAERQDLTFRLTPIGCGLAGYKPNQIAPMFRDAPGNVILPPEFEAVIGSGQNLADAHSKSPSRPAMPKEEDTHG